jgi:hypothetical protein
MRFLLPLLRHLFSLCTDRSLKLPLVLSLYLLAPLLDLHLHPPFDDLQAPLVLPDDPLDDAFFDRPAEALLQLPGELVTQLRLDAPGELVAEALMQVRLTLVTQVLQAVRADEVSLLGKFVLVRGLQGVQLGLEEAVLVCLEGLELTLEDLLAGGALLLQKFL